MIIDSAIPTAVNAKAWAAAKRSDCHDRVWKLIDAAVAEGKPGCDAFLWQWEIDYLKDTLIDKGYSFVKGPKSGSHTFKCSINWG